jgi:3-phytase/alkaline phosphatase D
MTRTLRSTAGVIDRIVLGSLLLILSGATAAGPGSEDPVDGPGAAISQTVAAIDFLGMVTFPTGFTFEGTEVGGLSGITYDPSRDAYYALSDDRGQIGPARYYTVAIDVADGAMEPGDVTFTGVTPLLDDTGLPYPALSIDPEGIAFVRPARLYVCSEGSAAASPPLDPFVDRFNRRGEQSRALPVPDKFLPNADGTRGVRNSLAFESLTVTPNRKLLYTATENALAQDGPAADVDQESLSRVLRYRLGPGSVDAELVYATDPVPLTPDPPTAFRTSGLVALTALDNAGTLLALERSFSVGRPQTVRLYQARTQRATEVSSIDDLYSEVDGTPVEFDPIVKRLLVDFADLGVVPDNLEGMTFGPTLPDGRRTLIVVGDNNFNPGQVTQFVALALEVETAPGVPVLPD